MLLIAIVAEAQGLNQVVEDSKGKEMLLGAVDKTGLTSSSFNEWFSEHHDAYLVNDKVVNMFKDSLANEYTVTAFFGSWCGDSKRELPRFYKVLEAANFPMQKLTVIAVDKKQEAYKMSPNGEEKGLNIHRVPTFIFYKNGKEVNRIVESPKKTFERDIETITTGKRYNGNYIIADYLEGLIKTKGLDSLKTMEKDLLPVLGNYVTGSKEINTYAYVKLRAKDLTAATYLFDLNTKLFPYNKNTFDGLGEVYFESKKYDLALLNYQKVLAMDPENKNAKEMVASIKKEM